MIYAFENGFFKVKDPLGIKYQIPIDRPDFYQVLKIIILKNFIPTLAEWIMLTLAADLFEDYVINIFHIIFIYSK